MSANASTPSDDFERLEARTKSELLFPRPPLINPKTNKRNDGRGPTDLRQICKFIWLSLRRSATWNNSSLTNFSDFSDVQTGIKDQAKGSSYIEMGSTKVLCIVKGPKDLPKKLDFR